MNDTTGGDRRLFWASFIALVATAFAFMTRALLMDEWQGEFALSETEKGEILGAGLWPFAISIVLFSLVIDRIGYGRAMVFAFVCHVGFAVITIFADGYDMLYWGSVVGALGNGTVEAVINPLIASMFTREKTKWLNILHAGWPGGLVIAGLVVLLMGAVAPGVGWQVKIALILIPTVLYGALMVGRKFPVSERVAAGVSHHDMLREMGWGGAAIILFLMVSELTTQFAPDMAFAAKIAIILAFTAGFGLYVRSFGRPMFVFLLIVMVLLATTELGTDSWITDLMQPAMAEAFGLPGGWVLVYTAFLMTVLRFCAGPICARLTPLRLLALSSALAAVGLVSLSYSTGVSIIFAATVFGIGKTFFWPTTLGIVSEQFPRGGAMTLNVMGGVGMLGVGVIGTVWLGNFQDRELDSELLASAPAIHADYVTLEKTSVLGSYRALDLKKLEGAPAEAQATVEAAREDAKKGALKRVAILPVIMLVCYLGLIAYFRSKGGYAPVEIGVSPDTET